MSLSGDDAESSGSSSKRLRVSRACDLCRRKKIKCDGLIPVCTNCQAFAQACSYDDTAKKRGPPKGYIEAIENRLHTLEQLLEDLTVDRDDPKSRAVLEELHAPLQTATGEQISTRPIRRGRRNAKNRTFLWQSTDTHQGKDSNTVKGKASSLPGISTSPQLSDSPTVCLDEMSQSPESTQDSTGQLSMDTSGQVHYLGKSSGFYLLQESCTYRDGAFHLSGWCKQQTTPKMAALDPHALPPKDLSADLVFLYFQHFYPLLPLFYNKQLQSSFDSPSEPVSPLLLNAIYAIASRVSPDVRVRSDPDSPESAGDVFFERARHLLDDYYDVPRVSTVQALLLMAGHQHGAGRSARAWLYGGMAFRMAQDLGLHRNCEHWNIPVDEKERRKRVFWCCFIADRLLSATFGRAFVFEERDCDVPFPTIDDDDAIVSASAQQRPARLLDAFVQLIKICDILGHVLKNIYFTKARHNTNAAHMNNVLSQLNRELSNWHAGLVPSLQYRPNSHVSDPASPISQIHMIYHTTVILLHRPFVPSIFCESQTATVHASKCTAAADAILNLACSMLDTNRLKYVLNFTVYYVFTAGIIFIKSASMAGAGQSSEAKHKVNQIMQALDEMELTWLTAARSCDILGELAGLRDIHLEGDKVVRNASNTRTFYPGAPWETSGTVTNSSVTTSSSLQAPSSQQVYTESDRVSWLQAPRAFRGQAPSPTVDPFAAAGTALGQMPSQFDPFGGGAFWGIPPSLDTDQWSAYFDGQQQQQQQQHQGNAPAQSYTPLESSSSASAPLQPTPQSIQPPLIPSHQFSPSPIRSFTQPTVRQPLLQGNNQVDMLSGLSTVDTTPTGALLLGFLGGQDDPGPLPVSLQRAGYGPEEDRIQTDEHRESSATGFVYW